MPKQAFSARIQQYALDYLKTQADRQGISQAELLEEALRQHRDGQNDYQADFRKFWRLLFKNMQRLEIMRDFDPITGHQVDPYTTDHDLTPEQKAIHAFYNRVWDLAEAEPWFLDVVPEQNFDNLKDV